MNQGWYLGNVGRIPLYCSPSALLLPLLAYMWFGRYGGVVVVAAILVLVVSVVLHELGHAFAAQVTGRDGIRIELTGLGGLCYSNPSGTYWQDVFISFCGPLVNFLLAGLAWALIYFGGDTIFRLMIDAQGGTSKFGWVVELTFSINLILGIFNMLPIYPMDGGQMALSAMRGLKVHDDTARRTTLALTVTCALGLLVYMWSNNYQSPFMMFLLGFMVLSAFMSLGKR